MAILTVTSSASVIDLDGISPSAPAVAHVVSCQDYIEFSRDVSGSAVSVYSGSWSFLIIANVGDVDVIAETVAGDYATFCIPAGGHILLPSTLVDLTETVRLAIGLTLYTTGAASRVVIAMGINNL